MLTPPPDTAGLSQEPTSGSSQYDSSEFDIVAHYNHILASDPSLNFPTAAISTLIALLSASPPSTAFETLTLLENASATLKKSVANPIAVSAGTDLFQRYIITTLQAQSTGQRRRKKYVSSGGAEDFSLLRAHFLSNSRVFVSRAKELRAIIAGKAKKLIRDGSTILICGRSRVVAGVLTEAAKEGTRFRLIYVEHSGAPQATLTTPDIVSDLRGREVPVATISFASLATALPSVTLAMVGAESVVENGGIVSSMGTHQLGILMKNAGKPFYVVAESHKFVRVYPLDGADLGIEMDVLQFQTDRTELDDTSQESGDDVGKDEGRVDYTPPGLITAIVTEGGVQSPSSISEELIKIW